MGDIISELFMLPFTLSEVQKSGIRANELGFDQRGIGVLLLNSRDDVVAFQKKHKERIPASEQVKDTETILGYFLEFSQVITPGKFIVFYVENGIQPEPAEEEETTEE